MASLIRAGRHFFEVSGTGAQQVAFELVNGVDRVAGEVVGYLIRQELGGLATAADFYLVCGPDDFDAYANDATAIPEEYIVLKDSGSTLTPSATVAFVSGPVGNADYHPVTTGRMYLVANVTAATGAWTFKGFVETR